MEVISTDYAVFSLDFNQNDPYGLKEYIKNTFKAEFVLIDINELADTLKNVKITPDNNNLIDVQNQSLTKTIKNIIDTTIQKTNDLKKKNQKLLEQQQKQATKPGKEAKTQQSQQTPIHEVYFQGQTEIVFGLVNWPLTPAQYQFLEKSDIHISSFINMKSGPNDLPADSVPRPPPSSKSVAKKSQKNPPPENDTKQTLIPYNKLIGRLNPDTKTPIRWEAIRKEIDLEVPFIDLMVEGEPPQQWYTLQTEIGKILKFNNFFAEKKKEFEFKDIPILKDDVGLVEYTYALLDNPNNFVNALFVQLKENNWQNVPETLCSPDVLAADDLLYISEQKTAFPHVFVREQVTPDIDVLKQKIMYPFVKKLKTWKIDQEKSESSLKAANLFSSIDGFNTAAGQQFDLMVQKLNKQFQLGLPVSFYDWMKWGRMTNKDCDMDHLQECIAKSNIIEVSQDEHTGVLYIMTLAPAQKQSGKSVIHTYMPSLLNSASEYYEHIYDKEPSEKKSRSLPTPSSVLKSKDDHDITSIFPPYVDLVDQQKIQYRLPIGYNLSADYLSPYLLPSGTEVDVIRNVWNSKINFEYKVKTQIGLSAQGNGDSLTVDADTIRIFYLQPNDVSFVHKDTTYFYKDSKLTIKAPNGDQIVLTTTGDIVMKIGLYLLTCTKKGTVGLKTVNAEQFFFNNSVGISYCKPTTQQILAQQQVQSSRKLLNKSKVRRSRRNISVIEEEHPYEPIQRMHRSTDPLTKVVTLIREDGVDYTINNKTKKRLIKFNNITINQETDNSLTSYAIANSTIPALTVDNTNTISFDLDNFHVVLANGKIELSKKKDHNVTISVTPESIQMTAGGDEFILEPECVQVKSNQTAFLANSAGDERLATLATTEPPPKKRPEYLQTNWGLLPPVKDVLGEAILNEQQRIFPPHYFAVRTDLSVTEFIFTELTVDNDAEVFENTSTLDGKEINFTSYVNPETQDVKTYISITPYEKSRRTATMKEIAASRGKKKLKKGEKPPDLSAIAKETEEKLVQMNNYFRRVTEEIEKVSKLALEQFREKHKPPPPPQPDINRIPPQTPPPALLIAARRGCLNTVDPKTLNFWDSPEAEFIHVLEVTIHKPRPPSSRTKLFDPPRNFTTTSKDVPPLDIAEVDPNENVHIFETSITPRQKYALARSGRTATAVNSARSENRETNGRKTTKVTVMTKDDHNQLVDFGDVPVNKGAHAILKITNTSAKPFKYTLLQPACPFVKVITPPGTVQAGFKLTIKLSLLATEVGPISTSFRLVTPTIDMEIPVLANIVEE